MSKAGLMLPENVTKGTKPYGIRKDNEDLQPLVEGIQVTMNPFAQEQDENLYCLSSGKKVPDDITDDLLNCVERGQAWYEEFKDGCFGDSTCFEKPIQRRKVKNLAANMQKGKADTNALKLQEIQEIMVKELKKYPDVNLDWFN